MSGDQVTVSDTCSRPLPHVRAGRRRLLRSHPLVQLHLDGAFAEVSSCCVGQFVGPSSSGQLGCGGDLDPFGNAVTPALTFPILGEDVLVTGPHHGHPGRDDVGMPVPGTW